MEWSIIFFCLSACSRALDQMIIFQINHTSWLPQRVFTWKTRWKAVDAIHFYQGITMVGFGLGMYFCTWSLWPWLPIVVYGYYQVFNLFFHVVFRETWYWEFPFFRFLWKKYRKPSYHYGGERVWNG